MFSRFARLFSNSNAPQYAATATSLVVSNVVITNIFPTRTPSPDPQTNEQPSAAALTPVRHK